MDHVGNNGFAILTVVFILGTYALALSLESIIDQWARFRKEKWGRPDKLKRDNQKKEEDVESKLSFSSMGGCFGLRRRKEYINGTLDSEEKISKVA